MKEIFIDLKNAYKNNIGKFYVGIIFLVVFAYLFLIIMNTFKGETAVRNTIASGDRISFEGEELTYVESIYYPNDKELEIILGINSVSSLFSEKNLKAKAILQKDRTKNKKVEVIKRNPQVISITVEDVPKEYLLARLNIAFKKVGSESTKENIIYVSHDKESEKQLNESAYLDYAIDFRSSFVEQEIELLNENLKKIDEDISTKEEDINELKNTDSLLTDEEKREVDNKVEIFTKQINMMLEEKEEIKNEIKEREDQLHEYGNEKES